MRGRVKRSEEEGMASDVFQSVKQKLQQLVPPAGCLNQMKDGIWNCLSPLPPTLTSVTDNGRKGERSKGAICK